MEHKIGEVVTLPDGRKAEVVEVNHCFCDGCIYQNTPCLSEGGRNCGYRRRSDHKNIIYKEIKQ